jgi:hypothetical protein
MSIIQGPYNRDENGNQVQYTANVSATGGLDVNIQDQTTPTLISPFNKVDNITTNTVATALDDRTITVADTTGFVDGTFVTITSPTDNRYTVVRQLGAPVGNVITVDTPLDHAYSIGEQVSGGTFHMNVDGSVTPVIYSVRAPDPGVPVKIDITRLMFHCLTDSACDLSMFGDIAGGLVNGVVVRKVDGTYNNIFNVKTNGEMSGIMYDFIIHQATNPTQGQDGFCGRLTFGGQSKMGVVIRLEPGEDLQCIIQDDLSSLTSFFIIAEGHVVQD